MEIVFDKDEVFLNIILMVSFGDIGYLLSYVFNECHIVLVAVVGESPEYKGPVISILLRHSINKVRVNGAVMDAKRHFARRRAWHVLRPIVCLSSLTVRAIQQDATIPLTIGSLTCANSKS
jgi:hypothetical protein